MRNKDRRPRTIWYILIGFSALIILCATACICTFLLFLSVNSPREGLSGAAADTSAPTQSEVFDDSAHLELIKPPVSTGLSNELIYSMVSPSIVDITTFFGEELMGTGAGSGIIVTADGLIVTNAHVVDGSALCRVTLSDGSNYLAKIIGLDMREDLAVLQINKTGLEAAVLADSGEIRVGERVLAIGNATGSLSHSFTEGIVSGLDRSISTTDGESGAALTMQGLIQTDAAINPGNSGGALVNAYGQVVGINTLRLADDNMNGIGFAISIKRALPLIDTLIDLGYIPHASLGVTVKDYTLYSDMPFANIPAQGVYFMTISQDSALNGTDIKEGDIIIAADGQSITSTKQLVNIINSHKPGDKLELLICSAKTGAVTQHTLTLKDAG